MGDIIRDRVLATLRSSPELRDWGSSVLVGDTAEDELRSLVTELVESVEAGNSEIDVGSTAADSFANRRGNRLAIVAAVLRPAGGSIWF